MALHGTPSGLVKEEKTCQNCHCVNVSIMVQERGTTTGRLIPPPATRLVRLVWPRRRLAQPCDPRARDAAVWPCTLSSNHRPRSPADTWPLGSLSSGSPRTRRRVDEPARAGTAGQTV